MPSSECRQTHLHDTHFSIRTKNIEVDSIRSFRIKKSFKSWVSCIAIVSKFEFETMQCNRLKLQNWDHLPLINKMWAIINTINGAVLLLNDNGTHDEFLSFLLVILSKDNYHLWLYLIYIYVSCSAIRLKVEW